MTLRQHSNAILGPPPVELPEAAVRVHTSRFGTVEVPLAKCFSFPVGLPGFPGPRELAVFDNPGGGAFEWLHSTRDADLGFPVLVPDRELWELLEGPLARVCPGFGWGDEDSLEVRLIVTIPSGAPARATLNMRAPVVLNFTRRAGAQPILTDDSIPLRMALFPAEGS